MLTSKSDIFFIILSYTYYLLNNSNLFRTFDYVVCDNCKDTGKDGEHELIAKTEAKTTFILKYWFDNILCTHM